MICNSLKTEFQNSKLKKVFQNNSNKICSPCLHKSAQLGYQVFRILRDYFLLTAGELTHGKRVEMVQTLFGQLPNEESSIDGEKVLIS